MGVPTACNNPHLTLYMYVIYRLKALELKMDLHGGVCPYWNCIYICIENVCIITVLRTNKWCPLFSQSTLVSKFPLFFRIMVLDSGRIKEFDKPHVLLQNRDSIFYGMARDAGLT